MGDTHVSDAKDVHKLEEMIKEMKGMQSSMQIQKSSSKESTNKNIESLFHSK